jgi:putative nitroreductase
LSNIKIMNNRTSVRSFSKDILPADLLGKIIAIITKERKGPFGSKPKLSLIDINDKNPDDIGKMTSYGVVKGADLYFGGYSDPDDKSIIDFGFCFQEALLELTALGLGTCWLGGTFGRGFIAKALCLPEGKVIPAISPVGISLKKRTIIDKLVRMIAKSAKRKPHEQLFFSHSQAEGLKSLILGEEKKPVVEVLEAVRLAPSASNKQPWRMIVQEGLIHLYWDIDEKYNSVFKSFKIQALDMGIALCHLVKSSEELNINGSISEKDPLLENVPWKYIASLKIKQKELKRVVSSIYFSNIAHIFIS